jgi:hypothetical protein
MKSWDVVALSPGERCLLCLCPAIAFASAGKPVCQDHASPDANTIAEADRATEVIATIDADSAEDAIREAYRLGYSRVSRVGPSRGTT